jgi:hypothetical protein
VLAATTKNQINKNIRYMSAPTQDTADKHAFIVAATADANSESIVMVKT